MKAAGQTEEVHDGKGLQMMESNISRPRFLLCLFVGVESRELEVFSKVTNHIRNSEAYRLTCTDDSISDGIEGFTIHCEEVTLDVREDSVWKVGVSLSLSLSPLPAKTSESCRLWKAFREPLQC